MPTEKIRVLCTLRQQVTWEGKTHKEMLDTPTPAIKRADLLERRIEVLERKVDEHSKRLSAFAPVDG